MDWQSLMGIEPLKEAEKQITLRVAQQDLQSRGVLLGSCPGCGASEDVITCPCSPFVVSAAGYTKAGDGHSGVPLFSFTVTDLAARSFYVTKTRDDFELLHRQLSEWAPPGTPELPKLPGKKLINANTHAHLRKRVGRLAEYIQAVLSITNVSHSPVLAAFLTDESLHGGLRATTSLCGFPTSERRHSLAPGEGKEGGTLKGRGVGEAKLEKSWIDLDEDDVGRWGLNPEEADALRAEVQRLRRRVVLLERCNRSWSHTLQHLLHATIFHPRRKDENRCALEKLLVNAVAESPSGKVSGVECFAVRTPSSVNGVPYLHLKQADGPVSLWGLRLDKGNFSCDLRLKGKKLGLAFECAVTMTMGLMGDVELVITGGERPSASVRFTAEPVIEVRTSGTKVTWGSLPVPMQEAVSSEIEEHSLRLLRAKLDPPGSMNFELGDADLTFDGEDAVHVAGRELTDRQAPAHQSTTKDDTVDVGAAKANSKSKRSETCHVLLPGVVREESIGLTLQRLQTCGDVVVSEVWRGSAAHRTSTVRVGDVLLEIGKDTVSKARMDVIKLLLQWPPGCDRSSRLVQLTLRRDKRLVNVNLEQKAPPRPAGLAVSKEVKGGARLYEGWEDGTRHESVVLPLLGLELEISGLDGLTRIRGFLPGGPAERAEVLFEGDEICEVNGQQIPVGIAPACARLQRIMESESAGSAGNYVQVSVRRKSSWGVAQVSHVNLWCKPVSDEEAEDWQVLESSSDSSDFDASSDEDEEGCTSPLRSRSSGAAVWGARDQQQKRSTVIRSSRRESNEHNYKRVPAPPPPGRGMSSMSLPHNFFRELTGLVTEALDAAIP